MKRSMTLDKKRDPKRYSVNNLTLITYNTKLCKIESSEKLYLFLPKLLPQKYLIKCI